MQLAALAPTGRLRDAPVDSPRGRERQAMAPYLLFAALSLLFLELWMVSGRYVRR